MQLHRKSFHLCCALNQLTLNFCLYLFILRFYLFFSLKIAFHCRMTSNKLNCIQVCTWTVYFHSVLYPLNICNYFNLHFNSQFQSIFMNNRELILLKLSKTIKSSNYKIKQLLIELCNQFTLNILN